MKRRFPVAVAFAAFVAVIAIANAAPAETILYTFTGLPGAVGTCTWFDDNLNDRSIGSLTHQTDLLYNRIALPAETNVTIGATATTAAGEEVVDFKLGSKTVCTTSESIYGPTPEPSRPPTPLPMSS